jgi:hypothetical protein
MKVKNATIGTRVIAKDLSDSYLGGLDNAEGQAGVIVESGRKPYEVIVRFDEKFNSSLWKRSTGDNSRRHWVVYIADLKLESKTVA